MSGLSVATTEKDPKQFALAIQQLYAGRSNASGVLTLAAGAASTTVQAPNCPPGCPVFLFPASADAAAEAATTYVPAATVTKQQFVVNHANNAKTDRTFYYVCLG